MADFMATPRAEAGGEYRGPGEYTRDAAGASAGSAEGAIFDFTYRGPGEYQKDTVAAASADAADESMDEETEEENPWVGIDGVGDPVAMRAAFESYVEEANSEAGRSSATDAAAWVDAPFAVGVPLALDNQIVGTIARMRHSGYHALANQLESSAATIVPEPPPSAVAPTPISDEAARIAATGGLNEVVASLHAAEAEQARASKALENVDSNREICYQKFKAAAEATERQRKALDEANAAYRAVVPNSELPPIPPLTALAPGQLDFSDDAEMQALQRDYAEKMRLKAAELAERREKAKRDAEEKERKQKEAVAAAEAAAAEEKQKFLASYLSRLQPQPQSAASRWSRASESPGRPPTPGGRRSAVAASSDARGLQPVGSKPGEVTEEQRAYLAQTTRPTVGAARPEAAKRAEEAKKRAQEAADYLAAAKLAAEEAEAEAASEAAALQLAQDELDKAAASKSAVAAASSAGAASSGAPAPAAPAVPPPPPGYPPDDDNAEDVALPELQSMVPTAVAPELYQLEQQKQGIIASSQHDSNTYEQAKANMARLQDALTKLECAEIAAAESNNEQERQRLLPQIASLEQDIAKCKDAMDLAAATGTASLAAASAVHLQQQAVLVKAAIDHPEQSQFALAESAKVDAANDAVAAAEAGDDERGHSRSRSPGGTRRAVKEEQPDGEGRGRPRTRG